MAGNSSLAKAKDARQDEFYTQLTDIEKELRHYRRHFQGKTVLCNCDDPFESKAQAIFPRYRKEMKGLPWGLFYNDNKDRTDLDPATLEAEVSRLMADEDVTKKAGVYEYLLTGMERCLSIRAFDDRMKRAAYERQGGVCPYCGEHFELSEMHADHIVPWSKGGTTTADNCQMLCRDCNLKKGDD